MNHTVTAAPIYKPDDIEDVMKQIVPDPTCRKANCYGRGYIGVTINLDGSRTVLLCQCAKYGETEYVRAMKKVDGLGEAFNALARASGEMVLHIKGLSAQIDALTNEMSRVHVGFISLTFSGRLRAIGIRSWP